MIHDFIINDCIVYFIFMIIVNGITTEKKNDPNFPKRTNERNGAIFNDITKMGNFCWIPNQITIIIIIRN